MNVIGSQFYNAVKTHCNKMDHAQYTSTQQISEKDTKSWVIQLTNSDCMGTGSQIK